jgi:hypothetical protein
MLSVLLLARPPAFAGMVGTLVTTDYFVSHTSIEPFYTQYKLDPQVVLHVREVVLTGRERTVPKDGKVVLLLHGLGTPGMVAFDLNYEQCSMMRSLAQAGWDTFTLDFEGYGQSTRPLVMDAPAAFPDSKAPIHTEVTLSNVERAIEFIRTLRGVKQVALLGGLLPRHARRLCIPCGIQSRLRSWCYGRPDTKVLVSPTAHGRRPTSSIRRAK